MALTPRHIQNFSEAATLEPHWGYADRALPCTNDPGSCAYLDVVYESHDKGMLYSGIFWLTILCILLVWGLARRIFPPHPRRRPPRPPHQPRIPKTPTTLLIRLYRTLNTTLRTHLLPTLPSSLTLLFGRVTRLQLLILLVLTAYLTLWSFVGIVYARWITPIKNQPPHIHNTRTSLGPWADRVGVLAYALTPLSILLASRENILSLVTGIPYTSFLFLHRWTGYIILLQSLLHTLGWVLVEAWLYQPQPKVWSEFVVQGYIIWGFVALGLLVVLWVGTWRVVVERVIGYEVFRKVHYVLAMVYVGALIGHWRQLHVWQSHPFTPLSLPEMVDGRVRHSYLFRAKGGETRKIAGVLAKKMAEAPAGTEITTPVILQGPYGEDITEGLTQDVNVLCVAGGTGITYVLPVLLGLVRGSASPGRKITLVWAVKRRQDLEWVGPELGELRKLGATHGVQIQTYVTAESLPEAPKEMKVADDKTRTDSGEDSDSDQSSHEQRPDVAAVVDGFIGDVAQGRTRVFGSGPPGMIVDLRAAVAKCNSGGKVWKGEERFDVRLVCDDRLEW
ncbi:hypothetical protein N0V88_006584 [Collariella sp. IMI 366227]|nr:hypothetical protein N0V88_006584 [Collariella sp. IMI 366227]